MPEVCRVGDTVLGLCRAHGSPTVFGGTWTSGSPRVTADGFPVIRVGDTCPSSCGHTVIAIAGSSIVKDNGVAIVRKGDAVSIVQNLTSTGTVQSGSPTVNVA